MMARKRGCMEPAAVTTRKTARVLLVDGDERVLLFRCLIDADDEDRGHMWITPGGGVRPGESVTGAGVRELFEETGVSLAEADLGPAVATSSGEWTWRGRRFRAVDTFFYVRVGAVTVDTTGFEALERSLMSAHRWWTHAEIDGATELVLPVGLGPLLDRLLAGERPDPPEDLPWRTF
jgi:ADP-ribose pyrophosphatase YjhB (NUDIX family)